METARSYFECPLAPINITEKKAIKVYPPKLKKFDQFLPSWRNQITSLTFHHFIILTHCGEILA